MPSAARADRAASATTAGTATEASHAAAANKAADADALGGVSPSGYARASLEPVRLVGTAGNPSFEGSWKNDGPAYTPAGFYKDPFGIVHLQGTLDPPNSAGTVFTLPEGYRPAPGPNLTLFGVSGDGAMTVLAVYRTGQVEVQNARSNYVSLDGVTLRAGQ